LSVRCAPIAAPLTRRLLAASWTRTKPSAPANATTSSRNSAAHRSMAVRIEQSPHAGAKEVEHDLRTGRGRSAAAHRLRAWRGVPGPGDPRRLTEQAALREASGVVPDRLRRSVGECVPQLLAGLSSGPLERRRRGWLKRPVATSCTCIATIQDTPCGATVAPNGSTVAKLVLSVAGRQSVMAGCTARTAPRSARRARAAPPAPPKGA